MMEEDSSQPKDSGLIYWSFLESINVYSEDKRMIGFMRGILIDPVGRRVSHIVVEVYEDILRELNIQTPPFESALVSIPTTRVKSASGIIELDADMASLRGIASVQNVRHAGGVHTIATLVK